MFRHSGSPTNNLSPEYIPDAVNHPWPAPSGPPSKGRDGLGEFGRDAYVGAQSRDFYYAGIEDDPRAQRRQAAADEREKREYERIMEARRQARWEKGGMTREEKAEQRAKREKAEEKAKLLAEEKAKQDAKKQAEDEAEAGDIE